MTPEQAVISSLLIDFESTYPKSQNILLPDHFYDPRLSKIYEELETMKNENVPVDVITVGKRIKDKSHDVDLIRLVTDIPSISNFEFYRDLVIKDYHQRRIKSRMAEGIKDPNDSIIEEINIEWQGIQSLGSKEFDISKKMQEYIDILEKRSKGEETRYVTGFPSLDNKLNILKRGELCIVAARTSLGKTALMLSLMLRMSKQGLKTMFVSGEMSFYQLMDRILSIESKIELGFIRNGRLNGYWPRITQTISDISENKNFKFVEAAKLSFSKFMPQVINQKPDILFVDYIQRFSPDKKIDSRAAFYSDIANGLKGISIEHNLAIVAGSQVGRGAEARKDRPRLSDLKESGGIEEAADVVWALHTENMNDFIDIREYKMLILKNRNGPTFEFDAIFKAKNALFYEKDQEIVDI